ncbi:cellulose-binding protein [Nannocystis pusilla]|uniref:cellulose-binding protein n=1 Tax=Nannocystis pusilla TaxID=889268 RepID=UPI003DA26BF3
MGWLLAALTACGQAPADSASEGTSAATTTGSTTGTTTPAPDTSTSTSTSTGAPTSTGPTTTTEATTVAATTTDETTATTDASTTGAPVEGCADLPLCDDFESVAAGGMPEPSLWTVTSPNCSGTGTLAIDGAVAHTGAQSLRVDGGGGYCDHVFVANTEAIAAIGPQVYGRLWVRFEAALGQGHVTFLTLRDSADGGGKDLRMGGQSTILMWNRESDDATLPALSPAGIALSVAPTPGAWTCVEFLLDSAAPGLTTWIDGTEVPGLVIDGEPTPDVDQQWLGKPDWQPSLVDFKLGWESYGGQTMTLYFDDVALAGERIGCDP